MTKAHTCRVKMVSCKGHGLRLASWLLLVALGSACGSDQSAEEKDVLADIPDTQTVDSADGQTLPEEVRSDVQVDVVPVQGLGGPCVSLRAGSSWLEATSDTTYALGDSAQSAARFYLQPADLDTCLRMWEKAEARAAALRSAR